jgi:hypothetical protein
MISFVGRKGSIYSLLPLSLLHRMVLIYILSCFIYLSTGRSKAVLKVSQKPYEPSSKAEIYM